jgi:hypothetical protein
MRDFLTGFLTCLFLAALMVVLLFATARCHGASVYLAWDPSPDAAAVGYAVYYGQVGVPTPARLDVGNVTNSPAIQLEVRKTYYFFVTAYDAACNESDPSTVLNYTVPDFVRVTVSCSKEIDGTNWMEIFRETSFTTNATWFYRVTIQRTQ